MEDFRILNLTIEKSTKREKKIGIEEPTDKEYILKLLNPTLGQELDNAHKLADYAKLYNYKVAVVGGCEESFLAVLELTLIRMNIKPLFKKIIDGRIYLIESPIKLESIA